MTEQYLTVTALTKYLKRKFEVDPYLERVYLTGEISNFRLRLNAHQYFSLKDNQAKISAIMFKSAFQKLNFEVEEGMKVLVVGRISLYEPGGSYQIYIEHMEPDGVGALYQALAQLRASLEKEGLFKASKKQLPKYPKRIAVLTSPSGAVIRDIITTIQRRYPIAQIVLFPTVVQGDQAAKTIVENIRRVDAIGNFDTMILGRGGGSIEDLWPFNEEIVARAIYDVTIPVISSVGHETDVTIADLVADVRAATPTAAAELAVPVLTEELLKIHDFQMRIEHSFLQQLKQKKERFKRIMQSYVFKQPNRLYEAQTMKIDHQIQRMKQAMEGLYYQKIHTTQQIVTRFEKQLPMNQVREEKQKLVFLSKSLNKQMVLYMKTKQDKLYFLIQQLDLLSPLKVMSRGYSYTTKENRLIKSIDAVQVNNQLKVHYLDGIAEVTVTNIILAEKE